MRFEIKFDELPAGYSVSAARSGENVQVRMRDFVSSEDGDKLISHLEGVSDFILSRLPVRVIPSVIDHLLAIIRPDKTGSVYINELEFTGLMRPRRSMKKGEAIFQRDILDIQRIKTGTVRIPNDCGFEILMSCGWRKGFYYDFVPLHDPDKPIREYDVELLLGQFWTYLMFQDLFKIEESTWQELFRQRWFPFIYLGHPLLKKIIEHARLGWDVDELLPEIRKEVDNILANATGVWRTNPYFEPHDHLLERAIERYHSDDHVSAAAILYPRIEGIMRSYFATTGVTKKPSASNLASEVVQKDADKRHPCCLFLPDKFRDYLDQVYFANFMPGSNPNVGRHSVAHGVARAEDFTPKSSVIGFLTLYQVALFLSPESKKEEPEEQVEPVATANELLSATEP
jgi:hypothetical protein